MRLLLLLVPLLVAAGCREPKLVVANRLAPGGGEGGNGGVATSDRPQLDIVVRMESDATSFNPGDLIRLEVNGVNLSSDLVMAGLYAILRIDPAPAGTMQFVELSRRISEPIDTFTWDVLPYTGPTLTGVVPDQAQAAAQVTIAGAGFAAGALRVFFGSVEGTVDASSDTSITATVPTGALPGLVYVLVDDEAAEGLVGFQPLDAGGMPVPVPTAGLQLHAAFPAHGVIETPVALYGFNITVDAFPTFNDATSTRVIGVETINVPPVGDIVTAFGVVIPGTQPGAGTVQLDQANEVSNALPFTVN
ncbi:MAG: IPT/TIG domain-containing protein [Planctomycetota bacterium]|jgi:hypothetical protein